MRVEMTSSGWQGTYLGTAPTVLQTYFPAILGLLYYDRAPARLAADGSWHFGVRKRRSDTIFFRLRDARKVNAAEKPDERHRLVARTTARSGAL